MSSTASCSRLWTNSMRRCPCISTHGKRTYRRLRSGRRTKKRRQRKMGGFELDGLDVFIIGLIIYTVSDEHTFGEWLGGLMILVASLSVVLKDL
nr:MAG TPA: hypothetical protein [Caudoviricetes sp.]